MSIRLASWIAMVVVQRFIYASKTLGPGDLHNKLTSALFVGSCFQGRLAWLRSCGKRPVDSGSGLCRRKELGRCYACGCVLRKEQGKSNMLSERTDLLACLKR